MDKGSKICDDPGTITKHRQSDNRFRGEELLINDKADKATGSNNEGHKGARTGPRINYTPPCKRNDKTGG